MQKRFLIFTLLAFFLIGCANATDIASTEDSITEDSVVSADIEDSSSAPEESEAVADTTDTDAIALEDSADEAVEELAYESEIVEEVGALAMDSAEESAMAEEPAAFAAEVAEGDASAKVAVAEAADVASEADAIADEPLIIEPEPTPPTRPIQSGTLTAADVDDNLNYDFFLSYLSRTQQTYGQTGLPSVNLADRLTLQLNGENGAGIPNAKLEFTVDNGTITMMTDSTGQVHIFPYLDRVVEQETIAFTATDPQSGNTQDYQVSIEQANGQNRLTFEMVDVDGQRTNAMDIAFVIDTTGSMGDELNYLTVEFESIVSALQKEYPQADLRFGLVVYRDEGDNYITEAYDFTRSVSEMRANLNLQTADGGGDYPEAMDEALVHASELSWRSGDVARVLILNADAPPHDQNLKRTLAASQTLRELGVRIYPLAASGVAETAEYMMRIMAATTGGRHLFLTDDSGVGNSHQEPKTQCYVVTRLDQLLIRVLSSELAGVRIEPHQGQVIREVGNYADGVCLERGQQ